MPDDVLFPTGPELADNGVWQQARPLSQYINDPIPPDPPIHPPACSGGNRITTPSSTAAIYELRFTNLPSGRSSINSVQVHWSGRTVVNARMFFRFMHNDGAGLDELLHADGFNDAPVSQVEFGAVLPTTAETGQAWLPEFFLDPYMRMALDTNGAFLNQRLMCWAHLHVDSNDEGGGFLESIGISWLPPLLAALDGGLNLYAEDWSRVVDWSRKNVFGCQGPTPSRVSRLEREWLLDRLFVRPRFVILGR